ncbi:MAG: 50S ribosomal protein L11 methyltransferase [Planctomycetes bacterium]|nr:50S ribosomal protein L11 methyltransferase [Planctomycetota bacterium]
MDPSPGPYVDWLRGAGVPFAVDDALARDPDFDGPLVLGDEPLRSLVLRIGEGGEQEDLPPVVEHRDPAAGLTADHATQSVAREMVRRPHVEPMRPLWEIGCGTGVLASLGGLLGAVPILGTDVDPRAIALARRTSSDTGVEVEWLQGSLLDPIDPAEEAHLVIANLPHKPCADRSLPLSQDGGPEGDRVFAAFAAQAARRLPAGARVLFFLHSLPHPRLLGNLSRDFDLRLLSWKRRFLAPGEYGPLAADRRGG